MSHNPSEPFDRHPDEATDRPSVEEVISRIEQLRPDWGGSDAGAVGGEPPAEVVGKLVGRYRILRYVGHGSFGVVYQARDETVGRDVALKIARPEVLFDEEKLERFAGEATAAAALSHRAIVALYEADLGGSPPYLATAFCRGPDLCQWLAARETAVPIAECVRLVVQLAEALDYAHRHGVLHRDLKPSNILLEPKEGAEVIECLDDCEPRLTDFGLAKLVESSKEATRSSVMLGTPEYMAPEQIDKRLGAVGVTADVYGLGMILYEMLVGRRAFEADSQIALLFAIRQQEIPAPNRVRAAVPAELGAICLKALEKRPEARYATAADFAEDLRRFLRGDATDARPLGVFGRGWRWARRHPTAAALVAVSCLSLMAFVAGITIHNRRLVAAAETVRAAQRRAEAEASTSRRLLYAAEVRLAYEAWRSLNRGRTVELLERQIPEDGHVDLREFAWHWLWGECHGQERTLEGHTDEVFGVDYSPDGKYVATASKDGTARVWEAASGAVVQVLEGHDDEVTCVRFSPDGEQVVTGSEDLTAIVWNWKEGKPDVVLRGHTGHILAVAFSVDGERVFSGGRDRTVRVWDRREGRSEHVLSAPEATVRGIEASPDGGVLAACDEGGVIHRWTMGTWDGLTPLRASEESAPLYAMDFYAGSSGLAAGGREAVIYCWDLDREALTRSLNVHEAGIWIRGLDVSEGGTVATSNHNGVVRFWNLKGDANAEATSPLDAIPAHQGRGWSVAWSPDGRRLASAGADAVVKVWRTAEVVDASPFELVNGWIWNAAFTPDSRTLVTYGEGDTLRLWDVAAHTVEIAEGGTRTADRTSMALTVDGRYVATADRSTPGVRFRALDTGAVVFDQSSISSDVMTLATSPDGMTLAVGGGDGAATLLELPSGDVRSVLAHETEVDAVAFSPDGKVLATCSRELRLWDVASGDLLWSWRGYEQDPRNATFSPDGEQIATAVGQNKIVLIGAADGIPTASLVSSPGRISWIAFHPDGRTIAAGIPRASLVGLWDVRTGQELCMLEAPLRAESVQFSPDGLRLIAAGIGNGTDRMRRGDGLGPTEEKPRYGFGAVMEWRIEREGTGR